MNLFKKVLWVGMVLSLLGAVSANGQFKSGSSILTNRTVIYKYMLPADTLTTANQATVDSLGWKVAKIVVEVLNPYGSNAQAFSRKNWGGLHIHDGDDGTTQACGQSIYMQGDKTFCLHTISGGDHSSALKVGGIGNHTNHRLINLIMAPDNTQSDHVGVLIRNASEEGIPLSMTTGADAPAVYIDFEDISTAKGAKGMIHILADSTAATPGDFVNLGLYLEGTSFEGDGDRYITMVDYNSTNYWGYRIDPSTDELLWYYNTTKIAGVGTDGVYTDYVP